LIPDFTFSEAFIVFSFTSCTGSWSGNRERAETGRVDVRKVLAKGFGSNFQMHIPPK